MQSTTSDHLIFITRSFPVIALIVPPDELRKYMLVARSLGMASGDYAFIQIDDFTTEDWMHGNATWAVGDGQDEEAREAMETVFWVF